MSAESHDVCLRLNQVTNDNLHIYNSTISSKNAKMTASSVSHVHCTYVDVYRMRNMRMWMNQSYIDRQALSYQITAGKSYHRSNPGTLVYPCLIIYRDFSRSQCKHNLLIFPMQTILINVMSLALNPATHFFSGENGLTF